MDLSPEEVEVSRLPKTAITASGLVDTAKEAVVYVKHFDMFFTIPLFKDTPAVLFLGNCAKKMGLHMTAEKVKTQILSNMTKLHLANAITSCLSSSSLVYQVKHTSRVFSRRPS